MEKLKVSSISKGPDTNVYIFLKEQKFIESIISFFKELGFDEDETQMMYVFTTENYNNERTEPEFIDINKMKDNRINIKNKDYDIDIFVGERKIILVIRTKKDKQEEISKKIFKIARLINE
ncbi:MAG: hypothetical protein AABX54_00945 [Nanoarchaeota archaeon]